MRLGRIFVIAALIAAALNPISSAFGQSSVTGANTSEGAEASSGDAEGSNNASGQTGPRSTGSNSTRAQDVEDSSGTNVQEGDNRTNISQTTDVRTGDAVAGQVIGGVVGPGGALSIDATNRSENVSVETGDAEGHNNVNVVTGPVAVDDGTAFVDDALGSGASVADITNVVGRNIQEGDNRATIRQNVTAQSGDGVGGQVIGAVVGAGGSASIAAANTSRDVDISTGEAEGSNDLSAFVGLLSVDSATPVRRGDTGPLAADITGATGTNIQEGDNRLTASQSARSSTGDGVGGQVLGVVSGGATSLDATNLSEDVVIETGDAESENNGDAFVGLLDVSTSTPLLADIDGAAATNLQEGDNRSTLRQSAEANTGDAVGGQIAGVVTSAGGSASVVLANRSEGIDSSTGDSDFINDSSVFNGLLSTTGTASVGEAAETGLSAIFRSAVS